MWLRAGALLVLLAVSTGSTAWAQTPQRARPAVEIVLVPGRSVWITDSAGREEKTRIISVSGDVVTTTAGRLRTTEIARVRARHSDSLLNGALIGAGAGVASALFLCSLTEPWEVCRGDFGPMFRIGAVGAGVGIGIDALIRGRRTIYEVPKASTFVHVAPMVGSGAAGLRLSVSF